MTFNDLREALDKQRSFVSLSDDVKFSMQEIVDYLDILSDYCADMVLNCVDLREYRASDYYRGAEIAIYLTKCLLFHYDVRS